MAGRYTLTQHQIAALRALAALAEQTVEVTPAEVAVDARLTPSQTRTAMGGLERVGLVVGSVPVTARTGESLYTVTDEGRDVYRTLSQLNGTPPVGTVVTTPRSFTGFTEWLSRSAPSHVVVAPDDAGG